MHLTKPIYLRPRKNWGGPPRDAREARAHPPPPLRVLVHATLQRACGARAACSIHVSGMQRAPTQPGRYAGPRHAASRQSPHTIDAPDTVPTRQTPEWDDLPTSTYYTQVHTHKHKQHGLRRYTQPLNRYSKDVHMVLRVKVPSYQLHYYLLYYLWLDQSTGCK